MPGDEKRLLTMGDLAELLGVCTATLRRWRKAGTGPAWIQISEKSIRYTREAVNDWLGNSAR